MSVHENQVGQVGASIAPYTLGAAIFYRGGEISSFNARAKATRLKWNLAVQDYEIDGGIKNCQKIWPPPCTFGQNVHFTGLSVCRTVVNGVHIIRGVAQWDQR